jgi:hypothetical protein
MLSIFKSCAFLAISVHTFLAISVLFPSLAIFKSEAAARVFHAVSSIS